MLVDVILIDVMFEARDSCELACDMRDLRANGDNATFASGTKIP